jgi:putative ABC transport system ATP-binding protein
MIRWQGVSKVYAQGDEKLVVLNAVDFQLNAGEFVSIVGPSGSGKSTLMNVLGLLDRPTQGGYYWDETLLSQADAKTCARWRNQYIGFVFQAFMLLPRLTALDNVALPLRYRGWEPERREEQAYSILARLGLADRAKHFPQQLSGGQQQRVAIARALVGEPPLILADEPTGALDHRTSDDVMTCLHDIHAAGTAVVIITHDPRIAEQAQRQWRMQDGVLFEAS